jgi:nucleoside 2-deoxyribosyltransferase
VTTEFRVYIAGASTEDQIWRVMRWSARCRDAGLTVVQSWPDNVQRAGAGNPRDASADDRRSWSAQCLAELRSARALWLLVPPTDMATRGMWVELGYAYAGAQLIVSSGDTRQSIFGALGVEYENDEQAFEALCLVAARRPS